MTVAKVVFKTWMVCIFLMSRNVYCVSAVTSVVCDGVLCGRFGDELINYCHAKWMSYKYGIPLWHLSLLGIKCIYTLYRL